LDSGTQFEGRGRERSIREVIALVKRWKELSQSSKRSARSSQRVSQKQAARELGLSKKTLEDYEGQLQLAEVHDFNFI
jgi:DNA-binding transcriptional regulator YiaG